MNTGGCKRKAAPNPTNWVFKCEAMGRLPAKVSLKGKFPKAYKQIYGNCTSNAVLAIDAFYHHKRGWMPSTTFCYWNQRKMDGEPQGVDDGSYIETALDVCRKYGVCNAKIWPNEKPFFEKPSKAAYQDGLKGAELTRYYAVKSSDQVRRALASGYPVAACLFWVTGKYDSKTFIISHVTKKEADACEQGHAVVVVGYDDYRGLFEIRNSWGDTWGNRGYCYITYGSFRNMADWNDTYAVKG